MRLKCLLKRSCGVYVCLKLGCGPARRRLFCTGSDGSAGSTPAWPEAVENDSRAHLPTVKNTPHNRPCSNGRHRTCQGDGAGIRGKPGTLGCVSRDGEEFRSIRKLHFFDRAQVTVVPASEVSSAPSHHCGDNPCVAVQCSHAARCRT